jgi:kinetochore protein NDC80
VVDTFDDKSHAERDFFQYIEHAYRAFLEGDDDRCQELDDEKAKEVEERMKNINERNKQLEEVCCMITSVLWRQRDVPPLCRVRRFALTLFGMVTYHVVWI